MTYNWHLNTPRNSKRIALASRTIHEDILTSNFFAGQVEAVHLNEAGASFQHELVDDGSFGPMHEIIRAIATRGIAHYQGSATTEPHA